MDVIESHQGVKLIEHSIEAANTVDLHAEVGLWSGDDDDKGH